MLDNLLKGHVTLFLIKDQGTFRGHKAKAIYSCVRFLQKLLFESGTVFSGSSRKIWYCLLASFSLSSIPVATPDMGDGQSA